MSDLIVFEVVSSEEYYSENLSDEIFRLACEQEEAERREAVNAIIEASGGTADENRIADYERWLDEVEAFPSFNPYDDFFGEC